MTSNRIIRVGAAGIIVQDGKVLLVKFDDEHGVHYNFPGGGHKKGETLRQTVVREVKEETDADVEVGRLLVTAESAPFEVDYIYGPTHYLKLFFECTLKPNSVPRLPDKPDPNEIAVEWIQLEELAELPVIPNISRELISALNGGTPSFFEDNGKASMELDNK
ncbi:NUDIX domain-containing protein [Dehalococcoides mccartyi]|nr:NUDIX domain-containing protein [Dehalococcoides mccartyi]